MKHGFKMLGLSLAVITLGACDTMGDVDVAPPYSTERTAQHTNGVKVTETVAPAPVAAPQCAPCADCSSWEARALQAEKDLAICNEAAARVRGAYRDELKK